MNGQMSKMATAALLLGLLLAAAPSCAEETRTLINLKGERVTVPHVVPDREELALLKMVVVKIETPNGKGGLIVAVYGTDESKRPDEANYVELHD